MHTHTQLTQSAWWTSTTEICYTHCFLALFLFQSSSFCLQFVWKVVKQDEVLKQLRVTTEDACRQCLASHDLTSYCGDHELHTTASVSPALYLHLALHHKISSDHAPNQESTLLHTQSRARVRPDHKLKIKILTTSQFFLGGGWGGEGLCNGVLTGETFGLWLSFRHPVNMVGCHIAFTVIEISNMNPCHSIAFAD